MSITDIQRAFVRGLEGKAACRTAMVDLEDGGRTQRLSFHVVSGSHGSAYLSETIPADLCAMQHARTMAANFLEGRISGQSRFVAPGAAPMPATAFPMMAAPVAAPVAVPVPMAPPPPPPVAAPVPVLTAVAPPPPATPGLTDEIALLDAMSRRGDIAGGIDLICRWIDDEAEVVRGAATTGAPGQTLEYEQIRREINDAAHGLCPLTPGECPNLWASVGIDVPRTGDDAADILAAAQVINRRIDQTNDFLARVRQVRIASKQAAKAAGTIEGALAVYQAIGWPVP